MRNPGQLLHLLCLTVIFFAPVVQAQDSNAVPLPPIAEKVAQLEFHQGFFDFYWDRRNGKVLLQVDSFGQAFLYQSSLARGLGSNDLGLDRGQLGSTRVVEFYRSGPRVLLIENNLDYRVSTDNEAERQAVASSFGRSVLWGFEVIAESAGSVLVDATDFFLRDSHGISTWLARAKQGTYSADPGRSAIYLPRTRAFPDNTEVEAIVTFSGTPNFDDTGAITSLLPSVVPDPTAVTVHLHHSLIRLPDDSYQPLPYDPRAGIIGSPGRNGYMDFGSAIGEHILTTYGRRHRLQKKAPGAAVSEAVEPIIYYLDPGAPEPVRSALLEGAGWWNQAFEAAGYRDAFRVEMLPEDADPMDVRYNVIQWVHRSTRGWSYGSSVVDPRTGEILKGHVTLGSLRVRQDYLIAEGLLAPYSGDEIPPEMLEMSLARIRQLSAHEVGHTLGFEHNFAASVNDRSSVMDYPFPLIRFDANGGLDLSDAYGVGVGAWDKRTVLYAYQDFPPELDESAERQKIMNDTLASGLLYVADEDSRDPGTAHPYGNLWDNGPDAIAELEHLLKVRRYALDHFSENNIRPGRPLAELEEVLVPIYLLHRFQIEAVGKLIGGQYFTYALRGDGQSLQEIVPGKKQQAAIEALLKTLDPGLLALPETLVDHIAPRPPGHDLDRESFARTGGNSFDPLAPARSATSLTLGVLTNLQRAVRLNNQHAKDDKLPGFENILMALMNASWYQQRNDGVHGAIQRDLNYQLLQRLVSITSTAAAQPQVRAQAMQTLHELRTWVDQAPMQRLSPPWRAHYLLAKTELKERFENGAGDLPMFQPVVPPGSPIGN